jgi:dTDP-4-amino-4,6-dideoxygalactose transaminase
MPSDAAAAVSEVLFSGSLAAGPKVREFESGLSSFIGNPWVLATGDISATLTLALFMAGVRPGDTVVTSPLACLATTSPIRNLFANVRWCDIDITTGNIDPSEIARRGLGAKAVLAYHWAGNPIDTADLYSKSRAIGLPVVEDAGEAFGAKTAEGMVGATGGDYVVFSFGPVRHITTVEGAAIAFGSAGEYDRARRLRRYGIDQTTFRTGDGEINRASDIPVSGINTAMNDVAGAVGCAQLAHVDAVVGRHAANGEYYDSILSNCDGIRTFRRPDHSRSSYWVYTLLAERRDDLRAKLRERGIGASSVHLRNDIYSTFGASDVPLPNVDVFDATNLSIPAGWWVNDDDREEIVACLREGW